ncbi:hypothetical protein ACJMK2_023706 [Sinanodonta woodiana]|uniref:Protein kinase domain-containing protein n=1 Tax=Sinanodonta woodiana TaxID=1069815 RepID=A0ABD3T541_SINWO
MEEESPPNQGTSVVYHPQPVSPSGVVDINPQNKDAFESHHLPQPEDCIGTGDPMKLPGDTQDHVAGLFREDQLLLHEMKFGRTGPREITLNINSNSAMRTPQSNAFLETDIEAPARPMKQFMDSYNEDLAKFKRKKGKYNACSILKKSKSGVLLPRPIQPRNQPHVTQPSQDQDAVVYDASYDEKMQKEVNEDWYQHLNPPGSTCIVSDEEFLKITEQLSENHQDGLWIIHNDLHPVEGAYLEGLHYKAEIPTKGGFGTVSLCRDMVSMMPFIQKTVPKEKWRKAENIALMTLKRHPNICELLGMKQESGKDGTTVSLFLEYAGNSLAAYVQQNKLTHQEIFDISEQMFRGLVHMHSYGILHLDLAPKNICIQGNPGNFRLKIIDFGSAKLSQEPFGIYGMTPEYLAPEVCKYICVQKYDISLAEQPISGKADVAAGALIILYMIEKYDVLTKCINNGQTSYTGKGKDEIKSLRTQLVLTHAINPDLASHLISDGVDMNLRELLNGCLEGNPAGRFSSQEALQFIKERKNGNEPRNEYFQQTTQAGERMFGISSQQDPHGINRHRDKTEPYPTQRHSRAATGVIPTTVNPETYPAASDSHGGNLPNLDILK